MDGNSQVRKKAVKHSQVRARAPFPPRVSVEHPDQLRGRREPRLQRADLVSCIRLLDSPSDNGDPQGSEILLDR